MKAKCLEDINSTNFNEVVTLFKKHKVYDIWEGFQEKRLVLFATGEDGNVHIVEDSEKLEKSKSFKENFTITSYF